MGRISRYSELEIAQAHRDYLQGATWDELGKRYGGDGRNMRNLFEFRRYPLPKRRQNGRIAARRITVPTDPAKLAYIAAMIDGEGFITCSQQTGRQTKSWRVGVANTSPELIDWLLRTVPGSARIRKRFRKIEKWPGERLPCYEWLIYGVRDIHALLCAVEPYLVIKGDRAQGAMSWAEDMVCRYERSCDPHLLAAAERRILSLQGLQVSLEGCEIQAA